uniref:Uncharacterized protein n=1 Tax=Salix viminalis TaxID=40686 RepID=A0A6N2N3M9_SALVM
MASSLQPSANNPPLKPWERAGGSSGPTPFKPPSAGITSDVVEASGTARPGEIVQSSGNTTNNTNAVGRPLPSRPWEQNYSMNNYGGMYGSSYGGGLYGNNMHRGGYMVDFMVLGCMVVECTIVVLEWAWVVLMELKTLIILSVHLLLHQVAGRGEFFWPHIDSHRPEYTGFSHVHDCTSSAFRSLWNAVWRVG